MPLTILVDADACPVKEEIYRVAQRHGVPVILVANDWLRFPRGGLVSLQVVGKEFDAADSWIVDKCAELGEPPSAPGALSRQRSKASAIVITADILLADACLAKGAQVISPRGKVFGANNIGGAVTARNLAAERRDGVMNKSGELLQSKGGAPAMSKADRSKFLEGLHLLLEREKRR